MDAVGSGSVAKIAQGATNVTELPIFPPTRTDAYDRCMLMDYLENTMHWVPKQASKKLVGGLAGRAFGSKPKAARWGGCNANSNGCAFPSHCKFLSCSF